MDTPNTTPNTPETEVQPMYDDEMILGLFNNFIEDGGMPKVTAFKKHLDQLINVKVKPLCSGRGKGPGHLSNMADDWRREQKALFAGRGAKWIKRSLDEIELTLQRFEKEGIDCSNYRAWTKQAGYAWVRYAGPRVDNGVAMAAFEVRTEGSKKDHPKQTYRMYNLNIMDHIELLGGTPHAKGLEVIATPDVAAEDSSGESENNDSTSDSSGVTLKDVVIGPIVKEEDEADAFEGFDEGYEVQELSTYETEANDEPMPSDFGIPSSDSQADWDAFLDADGDENPDDYDDFDDGLNDDLF